MRKGLIYFSTFLVTFALSSFIFAEATKAETLTNSDIIKMAKVGLNDNIIISKIKTSKTDFDLSTDGLISLKKAGISENIINAMMGNVGISSSETSVPKQTKKTRRKTVKPQAAIASLSPLAEDEYYARCNLKVIKGNLITWINWQSAPTFIPAGTRLKVTKSGEKATLINMKTGRSYTLDIGASGGQYLNKFITRKPVPVSSFPSNVQSDIKKAVTRVGMTREQAYIAMGPPTKVASGKTDGMTYKEIMNFDLWIYARRRFGKNIGIAFDPATGRVNRTEGIWGK